jgi:hypothetical protein
MKRIRSEHLLRSVGKWVRAGKAVNIRVHDVGRGLINANGAVETKRSSPPGEARNGNIVAENILRPSHIGRFRTDLKSQIEHSLIKAFPRAQHHSMLAEGDGVLVSIDSDVPDDEDRHRNPRDSPIE